MRHSVFEDRQRRITFDIRSVSKDSVEAFPTPLASSVVYTVE